MNYTDKQIEFGESVKRQALRAATQDKDYLVEQEQAKLKAQPDRTPDYLKLVSSLTSYIDWLRSQDDAKWWIDNRGLSGRQYLLIARKALG